MKVGCPRTDFGRVFLRSGGTMMTLEDGSGVEYLATWMP